MNWEKEIIKMIRAGEYDHEDVGHNETTLKVCNFIREHFLHDSESRPVEKLVSQKTADLDFGDYCLIEQNRFGADNEMYLHKVIGQLESNSYVDVPVTGTAREILHDKSTKVIRAITCGVEEKIALKYRIEDVKIDSRFSG